MRSPTVTGLRRLTGPLLAAAACAGALTVPQPAAAQDSMPAATSLRQQVTVAWTSGRYRGRDRAGFTLPGVGAGEITCRPDTTWIRMLPYDRARETTMWSALFEHKTEGVFPAVHDARVYTFSTPTSTVASGTGRSTHEGFNQDKYVEDSSRGRAIGLITQRTAFTQPGAPTGTPTSYDLRWQWSGFRGVRSRARCRVTATFTTRLPEGRTVSTRRRAGVLRSPGPAVSHVQLDWHGDADAPAKLLTRPATVPWLGRMQALCEPGPAGRALLRVHADDPAAGPWADVTFYEGEGPDAAWRGQYHADPLTGDLTIDLPENGMLTARLTDGTGAHAATLIASSLRKTNDPAGAENHCQISAQAVSLR